MGQEAAIDVIGQVMDSDLKENLGIDRDKFMMQVVTGRLKEAPFSEGALAEVRQSLGKFFGVPAQDQAVEKGSA